MTGLDRVVVVAVGLSAASAGLALHAAWPALRLLTTERDQAEQQVQLSIRIVTRAERFDTTLVPPHEGGRTGDAPASDEIRRALNGFRQAAGRLRDQARDGQSTAVEVEDVLRHAASVNGLAQRHQLSAQAAQAWLSLCADLDRLARAHAVTWNWTDVQANSPDAPPSPDGPPRQPATSR